MLILLGPTVTDRTLVQQLDEEALLPNIEKRFVKNLILVTRAMDKTHNMSPSKSLTEALDVFHRTPQRQRSSSKRTDAYMPKASRLASEAPIICDTNLRHSLPSHRFAQDTCYNLSQAVLTASFTCPLL